MELPKYKNILITDFDTTVIDHFLKKEMNLHSPIAIDIKKINLEQQRELIGLIENYFFQQNSSYLFPYPIYLISDHDQTMTRMPLVKNTSELPRFFSHKETKINIKESSVLDKNKLLQIEIFNADFQQNNLELESYAQKHKEINKLEAERSFYRSLLNKLTKRKK
jgi:hypothetical protein